ncbi:helix-turn-helix domain-containing protein [Ichthyenterobacterium sp. W332]|uniref:Helix-turn-helix domain-containing protein n=1 Tax=Microcosmobacter mediterraneus TaxID=3075607 RepID=A0ABU2YN56_9FLAO|nr:helix-turn-helix domain-containing protein [Ichthyenterobacterium sp. W332]MDT0559230.1 helix-turn-helix domain-containing protein [Ichthyenterobacterium sp. W332]
MKHQLPHIEFKSGEDSNFGFEIVPIEKIITNKHKFDHDPEQPHQLKFYNLIFFTEGTGRHFVDFEWYTVNKNSLLYLTKEQVNAFEFKSTLKGYCLVFSERFFVNSFAHLPNDFVFRLFNPQLFSPLIQIPEDSEFKTYFKLLQQEYNRKQIFNHKAIVESLFIILLSKAEQLKQHQTKHIKESSQLRLFQRFTRKLDDQFTFQRSAEYYAQELAVSYKHLNYVCKALINKTAKQVINDFIILQAKRNLINSNLKSSELAYKLGFEAPTNFTKYFKKYTGLTPNSFKKSIKK